VNIVGLSAFYHEAACCLLTDGVLVAAAAEERFSRIKHDPRLPVESFRFCLEAGGLSIADLDAVAYYEEPVAKLSRQIWARLHDPDRRPADLDQNQAPNQNRDRDRVADLHGLSRFEPWLDPAQPERAIRERLGWQGPLLTFPHHRSHAASAFFFSGFPEAAVLTVDGVGEWATTTYGRAWQPGLAPDTASAGDGETGAAGLELWDEVRFPHSLGLLYSTVTSYLGFRVNGGEYKVMGLAPYGASRYADRVRRLVRSTPGAQYTLDLAYFDFLRGERMEAPAFWDLFEGPPRGPEEPITQRHRDVARSVQHVLEEILLEKVRFLHRRVPSENLCMAGGVALNCVANGRIRREGPFRNLFVQPAAGDAGACLGAAALACCALEGRPPNRPANGAGFAHVFLGPSWSGDRVAELLRATGLAAEDFRGRTGELIEAAAEHLAAGRVLGWFHGPMEMGPRALGNRSILADPRDPGMRDRINRSVKRRESFRPFAPSVLATRAAEHFDLDHPSPFMLETCAVRSALDLPAVTHVDGSARPQTVDPATTPRFAALLEAFERRTGCPVLLNTSFNVRGEPIVCTPADALMTFLDAGLDVMVLEDHLIEREALSPDVATELVETLRAWRATPESRFQRATSAVSETLYTFV